MEQVVSITSKWQIHIPKAIRQKLKLDRPGQATIRIKDQAIEIKPKESRILKAAGKYQHLKPIRPIDLDHVRDYIDYSDW